MKTWVLVGALALSAVAMPVSNGVPVAEAARPEPVLTVQATASRTVLYRYTGNTPDYSTLGLWLAAPDRAFEVHVNRPYGRPAVTTLVDRSTTPPTRSELEVPFEGFAGLSNMVRLDVATTDGTVIRRSVVDVCPDGLLGARLNNDGPTEPTYPVDCAPSLWTKGFTYGIDRGWSVPVFSARSMEPDDDIFAGLPDGQYLVNATITAGWRRALRIPTESATDWILVSVVTLDVDGFAASGDRPSGDGLVTSSSDVARRAPSSPEQRRAPLRSTLPDLTALPAWGAVTLAMENRDYLAFSANVANIGRAPLVVEGYRAPGADVMRAHQFFYADDEAVSSRRVGGMEYDPREGHEHWHFLDFAAYDLLSGDKQKLERSGKEAFCLVPTDAIDLTLPGAELQPGRTGLEGACGGPDSRWIRQVLPAGWGDTYMQFLPGQSFDITDLPNGTYFIRVTANPDGRLFESRSDNNVALRRIVLGGAPGDRTVRVARFRGLDTEAGMFDASTIRSAAARHGLTVTATSAPDDEVRGGASGDARRSELAFICRLAI